MKPNLERWPTMWNLLRRAGHRGTSKVAVAEELFLRLLSLERKRSKRSQRRFLLMLLEPGTQEGLGDLALAKVLRVLPESTRETDIVGWYKDRSVIGVIFTEIGTTDEGTIRNVLQSKIVNLLRSTLTTDQASQLKLSFQVFPSSESTEDMRVANRYWDLAGQSTGEQLVLKATNSSI